MLIDTIEQVRNGSLDTKQATSVAKLSSVILNSARMDLEVMKFHANSEGVETKAMEHKVLNLVG